jgi:thymidylate kinase
LEKESSRLKEAGKAAGNMKMTYFVEGIQGSGKSTLVKLLSEKCPDHKDFEILLMNKRKKV